MFVLVSPTKTQKPYPGESLSGSLFNDTKNDILDHLQTYSYDELKSNMKISDKLTTALYDNLQSFDETHIAVNTYLGASFRPLESDTWDLEYAQEHFGILSALYGLVKPFQTIGFYRLDFLVPFKVNLYDMWRQQVTDYLNQQNKTLISLASLEYEAMILKDQLKLPLIRLDFKDDVNGKYVTKSTYAKTARGIAANEIIKNQIQTTDQLKQLAIDGYTFNSDLSTETEYIFTR